VNRSQRPIKTTLDATLVLINTDRVKTHETLTNT